jgi:hypothetical protein
MKLRHWVILGMLGIGAVSFAQTPWPPVQSRNYPVAQGLDLVRHEQSILLGESEQQTGLFFAQKNRANSNEVQAELVKDAQRKNWNLQTALRHGTSYVTTFSKGQRLLDIRLTNSEEGVEAVYSVTLNQQRDAALPPLVIVSPPTSVTTPVAVDAPVKVR